MIEPFQTLYVAYTRRGERRHLTYDYDKTLCGRWAMMPFKYDADGHYSRGEIEAKDHWIDKEVCWACRYKAKLW
jgi:hypothetical protein